MKRDQDPEIVSLEAHRRRRVAESRAQAKAQAQAQAKSMRSREARAYRAGAVPGERAINWRRAPFALVAIGLLFAAGWLVRLVSG